MMRRFRDRPLHSKLTVIIMVTCCTALVLGYAALAWRYAVGEQHKLVRHLEIVADVTGANTISALAFDDAAWVRRHLQSLQADPLVVAAAVYDQRGTMFASFQARAAEGADAASTVRVSRALLLDGEPLGSIAVDGDARQLHSALLADALIMSVIVMATGLVSWALATRLQRLVSEPIARLARTMERVATSRDYSQRVEPSGEDEVGMLIGSFNEMLDQIESRDRRSRIAAAQLEHLAHHDALTQLPNRTLFRIRLQQALGEADRQPQRVGVSAFYSPRMSIPTVAARPAATVVLLRDAPAPGPGGATVQVFLQRRVTGMAFAGGHRAIRYHAARQRPRQLGKTDSRSRAR